MGWGVAGAFSGYWDAPGQQGTSRAGCHLQTSPVGIVTEPWLFARGNTKDCGQGEANVMGRQEYQFLSSINRACKYFIHFPVTHCRKLLSSLWLSESKSI